MPLANIFGRRPVVIVCGLICFLANIWQALVTSYPSFLGARVISGLGAAANESLMPMVIADLLFVHQRGRSMALYFWAYFLGIFIGPIISGTVAAQIGWRWFFWICAILQAASLIFMIALHPETKYDRSGHNGATPPAAIAAGPIVVSSTDNEVEKEAGAQTVINEAESRPSSTNDGSTTTGVAADGKRVVGGPTKAQFALVAAPKFSLQAVLHDIYAPIRIFSFPIVLWAAFTFGFACNCLLALNLTEAQVFGPPPYLFNAAKIGNTNLAFFVGAIIALLTAGPLSDWIALRGARRNGGVLEAEMRLVTMVPYVCCCLVGMVVTAVGYQRGWPWEVIVVVGYGLVGVEVVGLPAVVISYAVDSYKALPGEIMIAATVIKNSFGVSLPSFFPFSSSPAFICPWSFLTRNFWRIKRN